MKIRFCLILTFQPKKLRTSSENLEPFDSSKISRNLSEKSVKLYENIYLKSTVVVGKSSPD